MKKETFKWVIFIFVIIAISSYFGDKIAFGYGGSHGGYSSYYYPVNPIIPALGLNDQLDQVTDQRGLSMTSNFINGESVSLAVPVGTVENGVSFRAQMTHVSTGPIIGGIKGSFILGNRVFNISARDVDNNNVVDFRNNVSVTISLPDLPANISGLGVYYFNTATKQWLLVPGAVFDTSNGTVTFKINHLTAFAIIRNADKQVIPVIKPQTAVIKPVAVAKTKAVVKPTVTPAKTTVVAKKETPRSKYPDGTVLSVNNEDLYIVTNGKLVKINNSQNLRGYAYGEIIDITSNILKVY